MEQIRLVCVGVVLGISTIIAGLSAGTMAVALNVYDRLIAVITPNIKKILAAWKFWLPLAVGAAAGIFLFSKLVTVLYGSYPIPTTWFFVGVIVGSIPLIYRRIQKPSSLLPSVPSAICAVIALAVMVVFVVVTPNEGASVYTVLTPSLFIMLVISGVLAALAMIIPGISGSFLLLVIGLYRTVLQAVSELNIFLLIPFAVGVGIGLFAGAAFVRFLLSKVPRETFGAVFGLVLGSILVLGQNGLGSGIIIAFSVICFIVGSLISFIFGKKEEINNYESRN